MVIKELLIDSTKIHFYDDFLSKDKEENKHRKQILDNIILKILKKQGQT